MGKKDIQKNTRDELRKYQTERFGVQIITDVDRFDYCKIQITTNDWRFAVTTHIPDRTNLIAVRDTIDEYLKETK